MTLVFEIRLHYFVLYYLVMFLAVAHIVTFFMFTLLCILNVLLAPPGRFLRGGAGRKTILLIFQPSHFIVHLL